MQSIGKLPKYVKIGLLVVLAGIAALFYFINPEEKSIFPECVFHSVTGYYCPGCGSQRAIHSFLHLDFMGVASYNMLFIPGMLVIFYGIALPIINLRFGTNYPNFLYYKRTPLYIFMVVVLFGILRNLPWYPFTLLAPS